jgi:hypothetical protein
MRTHYTKYMNHGVSVEEYMRTRLMKNNCLFLGDIDISSSKNGLIMKGVVVEMWVCME